MPDTDPHYGLERIVVIDAHIPGKTIALTVDDHANLTGTNGAGKTTLLRLIPFFYGAEPARLMPRKGVKKPLTEYLLPRATSMIVYEYRTPQGMACAVVYRHVTGRKPAYRFVRQPFSVSLFQTERDGERVFVEGRQLGEHWRSRGVEHSPQLENVIDYRAVIQGDRKLIRAASDPSLLNRLVPFYSLGSSPNSMSHMHLATHAILDRNASIEGIKLLVANILRENGFQLPSTQLSRGLADDVANIKTLYRIEEASEDLLETVEQGVSLADAQKQAGDLARELSVVLARTQDELEQLARAGEDLDEEARTLERDWDERHATLTSAMVQVNSEVQHLDQKVSTLNGEKAEFEDLDAEGALKQWRRLDEVREEARLKAQRVDELESGVKDIRRSHEAQCQQVHDAFHRQDNALRESLEVLRDRRRSIEADRERVLQDLRDESRGIESRIGESYAEREKPLLARAGELKAQSAHPVHTEEEHRALAEAEEAREQAEARHTEARRHWEQAQASLDLARKSRSGAEERYRACEKALRIVEEHKQRVMDQLNPAAGTWLSELHRDHPGWHNTLGRLVRPEALRDPSVAPTLVDPYSGTVLGWSLTLSGLEKPDWAASIEELQELLGVLDERAAEAEQALNEARHHLGRQNRQLEEASRDYERAKQASTAQARAVESAKEALTRVRAECREAAAGRQREARALMAQAENDLKALTASLQRELDEERARLRASMDEVINLYAIKESDVNREIDAANQERKDADLRRKAALEALESDYQKLLVGQGLDEEVFASARRDLRTAQEAVRTAEGCESLARRYNEWFRDHWSQFEPLVSELNQKTRAHGEAKRALEEAQREHAREKQALRSRKEGLQRKTREANEARQTARDCLTVLQAQASGEAGFDGEPRDLRLLESDAQRLAEEIVRLKKAIRRGVSRAEHILCEGADTSRLRQAWEELRSEVRAGLSDPDDMDALQINLTHAIDRLMRESVPQMRAGDLLAVVNAGSQLMEFFRGLKQAQDQIRLQSREMSAAMTDTMSFEAIHDLKLNLVSRIEQQDFWDDLERFSRLWDEWSQERGQDLPPLDLCESLVTLSQLVGRSGQDGDIESVFDLEISVIEKGQRVVARNSSDMEALSSNGLAYLILMSIYAGITRMLRKVPGIRIHWPVDELGVLHYDNVAALFRLFDRSGIVILGGFPTTERSLLQHFRHHHGVRAGDGIIEFKLPEDRLMALLAKADQNEGLTHA